jgi:hypothetical protein
LGEALIPCDFVGKCFGSDGKLLQKPLLIISFRFVGEEDGREEYDDEQEPHYGSEREEEEIHPTFKAAELRIGTL